MGNVLKNKVPLGHDFDRLFWYFCRLFRGLEYIGIGFMAAASAAFAIPGKPALCEEEASEGTPRSSNLKVGNFFSSNQIGMIEITCELTITTVHGQN